MPAPSTPTGFTLASRARPHSSPGSGPVLGTSGPLDAVKLTYTLSSGWPRLQMQFGAGIWLDVAAWRGASLMTGGATRVGAASADVFGISGTAGSAVNFRLRAENADGASAWTSTVSFNISNTPHGGINAPDATDLAAPAGLAVAVNTADELKLTWTDDESDESRYEVELRELASGVTVSFLTGSIAESFATLLSVVPGTLGVIHNTAYAARVRARCVSAFSGYSFTETNGDWSSEVFFTTATIATRLLGLPASVDFWRTVAGSYAVRTNVPATSISTGTLPTGLALTGAIISGTVTAAVGSNSVNITADSDVKVLTIVVREPALALRFATSTDYLAADAQDWAGVLTQEFRLHVKAVVTGPVSGTVTLSLTNEPAWLAVDGTDIAGTPTEPGTWDVTVSATNGTQTVDAVVRIVVAAATILSTSYTAYEAIPFTYTLLAVPAAATLSIADLPSWLTLSGRTLSGTAPAPGTTSLVITGTVGEFSATGPFDLVVLPAVGPVTPESPWVIDGYVGEILIEPIGYFGQGVISGWQLAGAPDGLAVQELTLWAPYGGARRDSIQGTPTQEGRYTATLSVTVSLPDGSVTVFRRSAQFEIEGPLYLPWLHSDPMLYDLQVDVRGDIPRRRVRSYYGSAATLASTTVATEDTATGGSAVTTTQNAAQPANLLTLKRGDTARLAVVVRDGRATLGDPLVANVRLALRLEDAADEEKLFELTGLETEIATGTIYWLVAFDVSDEMLDELMGDDSLSSFEVFGEILWEYDGYKQSSETFRVTFTEDVQRVD